MNDRPKGVVVYRSPVNPFAEEAKKHQKQVEIERREEAAERAARPVPNHICYRNILFFTEGERRNIDENGNWLGGLLPKCRRCDERIDPKDNHKCPGFMPKYSTTGLSREERRELIRAAWAEAGDWDDDQYDRTTPQEGGFNKMLHEAETGETYDQVVRDDWDEDDFIAWKKRQLGHDPDYDPMTDYED